ncbi:hypothetical protein ACROYT_G009448 [Oculina patagonica]
MDMYHTYTEDDGTLKGNKMPASIHYFIGQAKSGYSDVFFNLNVSNIRIDEPILSAQIRVMVEVVESIAPQPPLPSSIDHLVLFDQFNQRPVQTVMIQEGGARVVVFPVLDLVKRWIHSPGLNHGVQLRLQSNHSRYKVSVKEDKKTLLVVKTPPKPQKIDTLFISSHKLAHLKPKSRHPRAIRDEGPCSRRPMRVKLNKHINWKDAVVPTYYDAYRCGGECTFPLDTKVNPTNYAIVRSTLYSTGQDDGIGGPCCVPTKLKGISIIEFKDNEFVMDLHPEMVVEKCGCR